MVLGLELVTGLVTQWARSSARLPPRVRLALHSGRLPQVRLSY